MSEALRVLIVDDEAPARALLREYLTQEAGVELVGECANGFEAVKAVAEHAPDLVLLDVQMPKLNGFEVLELLEHAPDVVFCTAHDTFALRAFEVHAVDYLLKPFGRERLVEALRRARERRTVTRAHASAGAGVALARDARGPGRPRDRVVVRDGTQVHVIPVERIDLLEAQDDYVAVHVGATRHLKHETLTELADSLDPARFVRVHRSWVVNLERIARVELMAKDQRVVVLADGREVPVSRSGHERLRTLLG